MLYKESWVCRLLLLGVVSRSDSSLFEEDCILLGIGFNPWVLIRFNPCFDVKAYSGLDYPFRPYIFGERPNSASAPSLCWTNGCGEHSFLLNWRTCLLALLLTDCLPFGESTGDVSLSLLLLCWRVLLSNLYIQQYPHKYFELIQFRLSFLVLRAVFISFTCISWLPPFSETFANVFSLSFLFLPSVPYDAESSTASFHFQPQNFKRDVLMWRAATAVTPAITLRLLWTPMTPRVLRLMDTFITDLLTGGGTLSQLFFNYCFFLNFEFPSLKGRNRFCFLFFFTSACFYFSQKVLSQRKSSKNPWLDIAQASGGSESLRFRHCSSFRRFPLKHSFYCTCFSIYFWWVVHGFLSAPFSF